MSDQEGNLFAGVLKKRENNKEGDGEARGSSQKANLFAKKREPAANRQSISA